MIKNSDAKLPSQEPTSNGKTTQSIEFVDDTNLHPVLLRPKFRVYLRDIWHRRHFIWEDSKGRAFGVGRNTFLGFAWVFLNPIFQVLVYALVFGLVLRTGRGVENFVGFLVIGVIFFGFFSKGITSGNGLLRRQRGLIHSFSFPRALIPISNTVRACLDNAAPAFMAVLIALFFQADKLPSWTVFLCLPYYALAHLFILGSTLITARLTAFIPDIQHLITLGTRGLFFLSGIFFPLSRFSDYPTLEKIMSLNPIYQYLTIFRSIVLDGEVPSLFSNLYVLIVTVLLSLGGLLFFWNAEEKYASIQ